MKRFLSVLFLTLLSHLFLFATQSLGKLDFLRCEYLVTPLGVDVPTPRFSWRLPAHLNKQQAYQVIVGTDSVAVANGTGRSVGLRKDIVFGGTYSVCREGDAALYPLLLEGFCLG